MREREMRKKLKDMISRKRYAHTLGVMKEAVRLAKIYGADIEKARIAALLHDCAKYYKNEEAIDAARRLGIQPDSCQMAEPKLLHGPIGVKLAQIEFGVNDPEILSAIECHTTGKKNMTLLEKIIYVADMVEVGRDFPGVRQMRRAARKNLDAVLISALKECIGHVKDKGKTLHPNSIQALSYLENGNDMTQEEKD